MNKSKSVSFLASVRDTLWPIYGREHLKFLPMAFIISCVLFNYTLLRNIKDTLLVNATGGSEVLTFVKFFVVIPAVFVFFMIYTKISQKFSKKALFYIVLTPFLVYFALFALVFYPNLDLLHPTASADWLQSFLPQTFKPFVAVYRYWIFSSFYMMAELWGSVVLSLLFWQFANDVTKVPEAKRFYAHFYLIGNLAVIGAGMALSYFAGLKKTLPATVDAWAVSQNYLIAAVLAAGFIMIALYYYLNESVLKDPSFLPEVGQAPKKKKKPKMSIGESIRFLLNSQYLALIGVLVVAYGMCINFVEITWKNQLSLQFADKNDYAAFMGTFYTILGASTFVVILVGSSVVRKFGWKKGAMATPIVIGVTSAIFFLCMLFPGVVEPLTLVFGITPLFLTVVMGSIQNIMSKSTKYALFDPTKEMAYIPLSDDLKMRGKAAVDVVGARFGKSGAALLQAGMFLAIGPVEVLAPILAVMVLGIVFIWTGAVSKLYALFVQAGGEKE